MNTPAARFFRLFVYSLEAFVITFIISFISATFLSDYPSNPAKVIVSLAPVVPGVFMIIFLLQYFSKIDELQQRIQLIAIGFSAGTTGLLTFFYGFLENAGFRPVSLMWVFPLMLMLWGVGLAFVSRRYK